MFLFPFREVLLFYIEILAGSDSNFRSQSTEVSRFFAKHIARFLCIEKESARPDEVQIIAELAEIFVFLVR